MPKQKDKVQVIVLTGAQPEKPYRPNTARALYWASLQEFAGQDGVELSYLHTVWGDAKTAPKLPKSGKVEPPNGWVSYFMRQGLAKVALRDAK